MSDTYYSYQDVKVKIAHRLFKMDGWKVYRYHADASDAMTDYYDPASWGGVAEKNGYILVVDGYSEQKEPEYITKRTTASAQADAETAAKIAKLEQMTQARGASAQEEATARAKIESLRNKKAEADGITEEKVLYCPAHKQNPPRCNWHIEKDGIILDKGNGILKFASVPDISGSGYAHEVENWQKYNNMTAKEWKADYIADEVRRWGENERERATQNADYSYNRATEKYALLDKFNALIARWNNICGGMVSNGSGEDGYIYEEITVTEYKAELKPQETAGSIKDGQCFILKSNFTYGKNKGYVYRIHENSYTDKDGKNHITYRAYRLGKGYKKERTGTADNSNEWYLYNVDKFYSWIEKGAISFCELVEVKTPYEVKKVVKKAVQTESRTTAEATQSEESTTAEEMPTEEEKTTENGTGEATQAQPTEETADTITAEPETDMFADLARAFITGKQAPKKPKKAQEELQTEETPKEEEKAEEEPQLYIVGYHGEASDILTAEEIQALTQGAQIYKGEKWTERTYIATPYATGAFLAYVIDGATIEPDRNAKYAGFIANGAYFNNTDAIKAKLADDIDRELKDRIPDEDTAKALFDTLPDDSFERRDIDGYLTYDRTGEAQRLFYEDKKPELHLYGTGRNISTATIIKYILEPEKTVAEYATIYAESKKAEIYKRWIDYTRTAAKYDEITADKTNRAYTIKRISKAIKEEKTVKILLANGAEVKAEAAAVKRITCGSISSWSVNACDRQHLTNREIKPEEIKQITHGGRILYKAS